MYGPPPDPRQTLAPVEVVDVPELYLLCIALGMVPTLVGWQVKRLPMALRALLLILGQVVILTMPLAVCLDDFWFGAFPTIDKEGSLLFYLDGVHQRLVLHPVQALQDPAARLIGVHIGHLWVTQLFDLALSPMGAFNAQALLYPVLGWWCAWLLLRDVCSDHRVAFVVAFPFGMSLHLFRDLNWYTIEKGAVFWLALFAWAFHRAWERGGRWRVITSVIYLLMSWMNLYLGLVAAGLGALALLGTGLRSLRVRAPTEGFRRVLQTDLACVVAALPLVLYQYALMSSGGPSLGSPERFLWERAALDGFSIVPFRWNRLEVHRSLNLVVVGLAMLGAWYRRRDPRVQFCVFAGWALFLVSIGPVLLPGPVENPVYFAVRAVVPGFWRVAKPEVFFLGTWLLMLCVAALQLQRVSPRRGGLGLLYGLFVLGWVLMVRTHPAYPDMSQPVESRLRSDWAEKVFEGQGSP